MRKLFLPFCLLSAVLSPIFLKADNYVIFNQIMYDSPLNERVFFPPYSNGEFMELYNGSELPVSLHGWSIVGESPTEHFDFPDISIASKGFLQIAFRHEDSPTFTLENLFTPPLVLQNGNVIYQNKVVLANQGETITLYNANQEIVDQITYDGTSHLSKPDRLSAYNEDSISGNQCVSLHRTWVEFDENGRVVLGSSQWKTDLVSFDTCLLAETSFYEHYLVDYQSSQLGDNYILSVTPLDPTSRISTSNNGISVSNGVRTHTTIQYYDGLGRPVESIAMGATPGKSDFVQITDYSGLRRVTNRWLPTPMLTEGQLINVSDVKSQAQAYYSDNRPFVETLYENSALERVTGQQKQGDSWEDHPTSNTYSLNEETDNIRIYTIVRDSILKTTGEKYAAHTLFKTITADEDGKSETVYTDKLGRTVAEERDGNLLYYVYDDLGHMRYVLPHISPSKLSNGEYAPSDSTLRTASYYYKYDDRGNVIYKRLPGCEPQYMVYDKAGHLILSQDGNQRLSHKWTLFTYDSIGRNLYTAELLSIASHAYHLSHFADIWYVEHYGNNPSNTSIAGTGYASSIFPKSNLRMLTINYYDDYDYISRLSTPLRQAIRFAQESGYGLKHDNATGLLTGSRIYNLSEDGYTAISYYYDAKGQVVQSRSVRSADNYKTATSSEYLFDGSVAQQLTIQGTDSSSVRERYRYTYDHIGRLINTRYQLNNEEEILLSAFSYDSIGRLVQNLLYNNRDTIRYSYDIQNMLTETNNKHFSERLYYADNVPQYGIQCYNGNISVITTTLSNLQYTTYHRYDNLNRLTYAFSDPKYGRDTGERFTYDEMGNIISLQRRKSDQLIDDLSFDYGEDGNFLLSITDSGQDADDYGAIEYLQGANTTGNIMSYDANGNLIEDLDRDISRIHYNILNLPDTIQFVNGHQIVNLYYATGKKYRTIDFINLISGSAYNNYIAHYTFEMDSINYRVTEYEGNIVKIHTKEDSIITSEQIIYNTIGYKKNGTHYHYIKNHIGNNSAVVNSVADTLVQGTVYYASGVPMESSFGRDEQPYLYNGKEFIEAHGLNEYDSQARMYYATIMRTTTMDPLAEKYYHISPYAWCGNDPINMIDVDGRFPVYDSLGYFLGVDEFGLQGEAIIMDREMFENGMPIEESTKLNLGTDVLSSEALTRYQSHYNTLPSRPDWEGIVSIYEGIRWAKSHPNALSNPTPDNMLYINSAWLDFGNISISDCKNGIGQVSSINLFNKENIKNSLSNPVLCNTIYALGIVNVRLINPLGHIQIVNDAATDYDWNAGGGFFRNLFIHLEWYRTGITEEHGFKAIYYGYGSIRTK